MSRTAIPPTARAAVIATIKEDLVIKEVNVIQPSELAAGECLVKVEYAGCCHSDVHVKNNDWGRTQTPVIGGHEGVGHVVAIGANTVGSPVKVGDRVGMKWFANACLKCEMCRLGFESCCTLARQQSHGNTVDGTFAEYTRCWVDYLTPIPDGLDSAAVTPLLCAGLTIYKALKLSNAKPGHWVALSGAGGGLGHLGIQFAVAMGLRVIAIDTGAEKKDLCLKLGAEKWVDFAESKDIVKDVQEAAGGLGPHAAIIAVGNALPFNQAIMYLRSAATLVAIGMPGPANGILNIPIALLVSKGEYIHLVFINIYRCIFRNRQDMAEALDFMARGKVNCHHEIRDFKEVNNALKDVSEGKVKGRIVLKIAS
ncbi:chaperonin 10-like protein [Lentinula edodes]|nr:chaperonin 10-like protein [Lentinula edodes]